LQRDRLAPERGDFRDDRFGLGGIRTEREDDVAARAGDAEGGTAAEAATRAGDEGDAGCGSAGHGGLPGWVDDGAQRLPMRPSRVAGTSPGLARSSSDGPTQAPKE